MSSQEDRIGSLQVVDQSVSIDLGYFQISLNEEIEASQNWAMYIDDNLLPRYSWSILDGAQRPGSSQVEVYALCRFYGLK